MKKVRFESPHKLAHAFNMNESECHSPRPFLDSQFRSRPVVEPEFPRVVTYTNDPVHRFETSNSSPYPVVSRTQLTCFPEKEPCWKPSNDLDLSLLDTSCYEPRQPGFCKSILKERVHNNNYGSCDAPNLPKVPPETSATKTQQSNEPPNVLVKDNSFFIKRDNLNKYQFSINPIQTQLKKLSLDKENDPFARKGELMKVQRNDRELLTISPLSNMQHTTSPVASIPTLSDDCRCHHCVKNTQCMDNHHLPTFKEKEVQYSQCKGNFKSNCMCNIPKTTVCHPCHISPVPPQQNVCKTCNCHSPEVPSPGPQNPVDRKTWTIEKYEQSKQATCTDIEKQKLTKEKREPTVADLFKIIKLQNEQLQLLQEKVDKFLCVRQNQPTITCSTEHVAVNSIDNNKMSVGVMTSFEMIRTSTVINKEVVTQSNEAIQCNRSQISIKEVSKPVNMNFLDGIVPANVDKNMPDGAKCMENDEKTVNEQSLFNVQVDNATTPLISPEQTLYLDVRDYSDSEASSTDQSNVGWTYYNKVMTHVNGMLQDSEMPSSASAMYRNLRQQCVQMHIDTTNVSVTKRVKFGDDPLGLHQPHIYAPSTDTSLKMNQLAAKYLNGPVTRTPRPLQHATTNDMSMATRNYMEKHRLLQGLPGPSKSPQTADLPKFLDITALKQQPKFL